MGEALTVARRRGGLLWHRNFRLLWFGETVNQLGSAMALVGVPLLAVIDLRASPLVGGDPGHAPARRVCAWRR